MFITVMEFKTCDVFVGMEIIYGYSTISKLTLFNEIY